MLEEKTHIFFKYIFWAFLGSISILYFSHLPSTVQTGDSGELVAAAHKLLVVHPPGYPLWLWVNHAWDALIPLENVFFKAALLNALFSMGTLYLIFTIIGRNAVALATISVVAVNQFFWKYAEIPEVFSFHLLLSCVFIYFCFSEKTVRINKTDVHLSSFSPLAFGLAASHHHTIVFLLPLLLWQLWRHKKNKIFFISSALGMLLMFGLYLSMLLLNTDHLYSWSSLHDAKDVLLHFLRKSYGTFNLTGQNSEGVGSIYISFIYYLFTQAWPLLAVASVISISDFRNKAFKHSGNLVALFISLCFYLLVFFPLASAANIGFMSEVIPRFFLFPFILLAIIVGIAARNLDVIKEYPRKIASVGFSVVFVLCYGLVNTTENNFSKNTIVEDYAINLLKATSDLPRRLIFTNTDTELFATRYTQLVLGISPTDAVLTDNLYGTDWFNLKLTTQWPDWKTSSTTDTIDFAKDILIPNAAGFSIVSTKNLYSPDRMKSTFYPLGIHLEEGKEYYANSNNYVPQFRSEIEIIKTPPHSFSTYRELFAKYSFYFIIEGQLKFKSGDPQAAISSFEKALAIFPYATPALENLCNIKKELNLQDPKCGFLPEIKGYYNYFSR